MQYLVEPLPTNAGLFPSSSTTYATVSSGQTYALVASPNGLCMGLDSNQHVTVVQANWAEDPYQQWKFIWDSTGFKIQNVGSGGYLQIQNGSTASGAALITGSYSGASYQKWTLLAQASGQVQLVSMSNQKVIQLNSSSLQPGDPVEMGSNGNNDYEMWYVCAVVAAPSQADLSVTLYTGSNYSGHHQVLGVGSYDKDQFTIGNNTLSSMRIPAGMRVTVFSESNFRGDTTAYTADVAQLSTSMNNRGSSLVVERVITAYTGTNYTGTSTTFGIGRYPSTWLGDVGDNAIQSVKIPPGLQLTAYSKDNFSTSGDVVTLITDASSLGGMAARISSLIVKQLGVSVPHDVLRYGGTIMLKSSSTGNYLIWDSNDSSSSYDLDANGSSSDADAVFTIWRAGRTVHASMVSFGDVVTLRAANGRYLHARGTDESDETRVDQTSIDNSCQWTIVRSGASASNSFVAQGDVISLMSVKYNRYLHIVSSTEVTSSASKLDDKEMFTIKHYTPPSVDSGEASGEGPCGAAACGANVCAGEACGADACGAAACGWAANLLSACGAAADGIVVCGADLAMLSSCGVAASGATACGLDVCGAAATGVTACAAAICGVDACGGAACGAAVGFLAACGADACGAAACGAAACGAAACGAAACGANSCGGEAEGVDYCGVAAHTCGAQAGGIDLCWADACAANVCGINLCPADACTADACLLDIIPIVPGI